MEERERERKKGRVDDQRQVTELSCPSNLVNVRHINTCHVNTLLSSDVWSQTSDHTLRLDCRSDKMDIIIRSSACLIVSGKAANRVTVLSTKFSASGQGRSRGSSWRDDVSNRDQNRVDFLTAGRGTVMEAQKVVLSLAMGSKSSRYRIRWEMDW